MENHLPNGTVLPHGLLGVNAEAAMGAFNKAYKNTALRMGIVVASYSISDPQNFTKLTTEYDVIVLEQNENSSCTNQRYRNCLSSEGMGSLADYFEKNLRVQTQNGNANGAVNTSNQNGAIVILHCLDAFTQKAIIISGLTHPDRDTKLTSTDPMLFGEYNGVAIAVNTDGSTILTFNGATDNNGDVIDSSQGITTVQIEKDGTFQVQNSAVTLRLDKTAQEVNMTSTGNWTVNIQGDTNITTEGTTTITSTGDATINTKGDADITASGKITMTAPEIDLNTPLSGVTTFNSHLGVIDLLTNVPVEPSLTVFADV